MTDDRKESLEKLEDELLSDDLLSDMPASLFNNETWIWDEENTAAEDSFSAEDIAEEIPMEEPVQVYRKKNEGNTMRRTNRKMSAQQKEDKWLIILMAIASFLCLGIIGVMIYWLEVFLK